jgi:hypothetical protein
VGGGAAPGRDTPVIKVIYNKHNYSNLATDL